MDTGHSSLRAFLARRRPVERPEPDDPADMGACFGLEMTLAAAAAGEPAAPGAAPTEPWWHRTGPLGPLPA
jgi:hypothetical protein